MHPKLWDSYVRELNFVNCYSHLTEKPPWQDAHSLQMMPELLFKKSKRPAWSLRSSSSSSSKVWKHLCQMALLARKDSICQVKAFWEFGGFSSKKVKYLRIKSFKWRNLRSRWITNASLSPPANSLPCFFPPASAADSSYQSDDSIDRRIALSSPFSLVVSAASISWSWIESWAACGSLLSSLTSFLCSSQKEPFLQQHPIASFEDGKESPLGLFPLSAAVAAFLRAGGQPIQVLHLERDLWRYLSSRRQATGLLFLPVMLLPSLVSLAFSGDWKRLLFFTCGTDAGDFDQWAVPGATDRGRHQR